MRRIVLVGLVALGCAAGGPVGRAGSGAELCALVCEPSAVALGEIRMAGPAAWLPGGREPRPAPRLDSGPALAAEILLQSLPAEAWTGALVLTEDAAVFLSWGEPAGVRRDRRWFAVLLRQLGIVGRPGYFPALRLAYSELDAVNLLEAIPALSLVDAAGIPQRFWYLRADGAGVDAAATRMAYDFVVEGGRHAAPSG